MTPSEIMPNMKFGHWIIIKFDHINKHRIKYFLCKCAVCGNIRPVRASALLDGTSTACSDKCANSLIGRQFGEWQVLKVDKSQPKNYICRCSCGNIKSIFSGALKNKTSLHCGCLKKKNKKIEFIYPKELNNEIKDKIYNILNKYYINFKIKYRFEECKANTSLPFDFAIFNENEELLGLIDINKYHFSSRGTRWNFPNRKIDIKRHDYIKQKFAEDNQIPYLIIPNSLVNDVENFLITSDFWQFIIKNFND